MKRILSNITIVDLVVVMAILLILAAIVVPSFVQPAGQGPQSGSAPKTAPARAGH